MKTIGLVGGISWHSTLLYYTQINEQINAHYGNAHSAKILMHSINFQDYLNFVNTNNWDGFANFLLKIFLNLQNAGADCIVLCSNTPHRIANQISPKLSVPFINVAIETANEIVKQKINKVLLLGTKFTMEHHFFLDELKTKNIKSIVPDEVERVLIHNIIIDELTKGIFTIESKSEYKKIIQKYLDQGVDAIVFGCTEISLLLPPKDCDFIYFDTAQIHAKAAVDFAVE